MMTIEKSVPDTNDTGGAVARTVDGATSSAHRAIDKASDAARPVVDRIAAGAHQAVDKLACGATQAAQTLDVKGEQLRVAHTRFTENCRARVRETPIAALGIAVAAGVLLGWSLSQR